MYRKALALFLLALIGFLSPPAASGVTIDTVPVGNPGNAPDPDSARMGAVAYNYRMGTYEVTVGQYTAFLNAVGATDAYGLYSPYMATVVAIAGIARDGPPGSYTYSVIGSANKPVTYVSWGDAARFANWLHNGQPTGAQDASTTEDGTYTLNGATTDAALNAVARNSGATWAIASENEWYKAAYHKNQNPTNNYWWWDWPTNSFITPYSGQAPGSGAPTPRVTANFFQDDGIANGYNDGYAVTGSTSYSTTQNYLTDVGAYAQSVSAYGTFDQGGNVEEWTEALHVRPDGLYRRSRGGHWGNIVGRLGRNHSGWDEPTTEKSTIGFRVVSLVPEPSTLALAALAFIGLLAWGWRRRTT